MIRPLLSSAKRKRSKMFKSKFDRNTRVGEFPKFQGCSGGETDVSAFFAIAHLDVVFPRQGQDAGGPTTVFRVEGVTVAIGGVPGFPAVNIPACSCLVRFASVPMTIIAVIVSMVVSIVVSVVISVSVAMIIVSIAMPAISAFIMVVRVMILVIIIAVVSC